MAITTPFEFTQIEANHVVEISGQMSTILHYDVLTNTITVPPSGSKSAPLTAAIVADVAILTFCAKIMELYRPSTSVIEETEFEFGRDAGLFKIKIRVNNNTLVDLSCSPAGQLTAAPRSVGPISFPGFYWAIKTLTRTLRYIESSINSDYVRQLEFA